MNQTKNHSRKGLTDLVTCLCLSLATFLILFVLLGYLLYQMPHYEKYYGAFPFALLFLAAITINLICGRFSTNRVLFAFLASSLVSILSILFGFAMDGFSSALLKNVPLHLIFIFVTGALQILRKNKRPAKRKKLPFTK